MTISSDQKDLSFKTLFIDNALVAEGFFSIKYNEDGNWVNFFEKKNLIVNTARKVMANCIGGSENWFIDTLKLGGDNDLTASELLSPNLPSISDTDVVYTSNIFVRSREDRLENIPMWNVSYPNSPNETSVLFSIRIGKTEGNLLYPSPTAYTSAGLFAANGTYLFASQSFPVLTKIPEREFLIEWNIRF